ncbi:hypothetical protein O6H91_14G081500 [Diphasiastrum complanatum]|uniref:Uncharacterized protein n=1 Tax=Diphasiastrum complanatum TaxID=34168 RepID=A0ACC2BRI0_DIPCM|nr:hypothetical protein O6H91_14G081500 [Diphasiastrum complanatum]
MGEHAANGTVAAADEATDREPEHELESRVQDLLHKCKALQDLASAHSLRVRVEAQALSQQALSLDSQIKRLRKELVSSLQSDEGNHELAEKVEVDLCRARSMIYEGDVAALLPHKSNGVFLRLLLGPVNVRAERNDVRLKVKEEYNTYRDTTALLFLAFPSLLLLFRNNLWNGCFPALPVQVYEVWLLFFYTSLALRENILRINGSDIRPWWVYHHYFAMLTSIVALTWRVQGEPNCIQKQHGLRLFLGWAALQGVAMLLQNRYQRQRLYTRIALGKAGRMDVVWGETAGVKGQLWMLYPLLFTLQGFEFFLGLLLLRNSIKEYVSEWQRLVCGLLLLLMAVGNFSNTIATVAAKERIKTKVKEKGKQMLQSISSTNHANKKQS